MRKILMAVALAASGCIAGCGEAVFAQAKAAAPAPAVVAEPVLSTSALIALSALREKLQSNQAAEQNVQKERGELWQAVRAVEAEIARDHPGYHLDEGTGTIVKDAAKVEVKPLPGKPKT